MHRRRVTHEAADADGPAAVQAAVKLVEGRVGDFIAAMTRAGNPGARRHDLGSRAPEGWVFAFDPSTGGATSRVVIDTRGFIYARRGASLKRAYRKPASYWLFETASPIEPIYRALALSHELDEIQCANGVPVAKSGDE
jgi:hypothetical protein